MLTEPPPSDLTQTLATGIPALAALLFLTAMVSGAEVAFFSLSPKDLSDIASRHPAKARRIRRLVDRPRKLIATLVMANTFLNISIAVLFSMMGRDWFGFLPSPSIKFAVDVTFIAFLILFFGDVLPKIYAKRHHVQFALTLVRPLTLLDTLLTPFSVPMRSATRFLQQRFGPGRREITVEKLSQALELTSDVDASQDEQRLLEGIVTFGNTDVDQIMTPRIDISALDIRCSFGDVMEKIVESGFSRIPVYRDNIDHIEGVLFVKDLLPFIGKRDAEWQQLVRKPFFVPENKKLDDLLAEFQGMKNHLAIVVDEYGGTSGIVTLEDILEEIVGDISDEFDDGDIQYTRIDENSFRFEGKVAMKDFYRVTGADAALFEAVRDEAETLGGFLLERLGRFPDTGQTLDFGGWQFVVEETDTKRIRQVKVCPITAL